MSTNPEERARELQEELDAIDELCGLRNPDDVTSVFMRINNKLAQVQAEARLAALEEAAHHFDRHENGCPILVNGMLCTCKRRWPWIGDAIRALARLDRRASVKIRIDGPDSNGKNTSRQIMMCDATVDEVEKVIRPALEEATRQAAAAVPPAGEGKGKHA